MNEFKQSIRILEYNTKYCLSDVHYEGLWRHGNPEEVNYRLY